jgi:hypothetical protein
MGYYSIMERKKALIPAVTWRNLENTVGERLGPV